MTIKKLSVLKTQGGVNAPPQTHIYHKSQAYILDPSSLKNRTQNSKKQTKINFFLPKI